MTLRAPFPWFGGKSRAADLVWARFGDVPNYVEPFAGSLAVLLGRPTPPRIETVNDLDCYLANFWRAIQRDPEGVAHHADWPVNEADLHARHRWLVTQAEFRERMKIDPDFCDAKIAGWWVWGVCQWIGSGWCVSSNWDGEAKRIKHGSVTVGQDVRPHLSSSGQGVLKRERMIENAASWRKRPVLAHGNRGVIQTQKPMLRGDSGAAGAGIHASGIPKRQLPKMDRGTGSRLRSDVDHIVAWMLDLRDRLRRVRVCCGDWSRVLGRCTVTMLVVIRASILTMTGGSRSTPVTPMHSVDDATVARDVREWAIANGRQFEVADCSLWATLFEVQQ